MSVAKQLLPQRIQAQSDKVEIPTAPDQPLSLYKVVVERVKTELHDAGFYQGSVDGTVGGQTADAVLAYQKANDLAETGQLDQITLWRLLQKTLNISSSQGKKKNSGSVTSRCFFS